jgi:hypothetical protein
MRLPDRTLLGMRLAYDAQAEADARRRVIDFLADHGVIVPGPRGAEGAAGLAPACPSVAG